MSDDPNIPHYSTRLWSEEVGMADPEADAYRRPVLAYVFGGKTFYTDVNTTLYAPPVEPVDPDLVVVAVVTRQGQRTQGVLAFPSADISSDCTVTSGQGQHNSGAVTVDGQLPSLLLDVRTTQGQRGSSAITLVEGPKPPLDATAGTKQGQYNAALVAVNGLQPGSSAAIPLGGQIATLAFESTSATLATSVPFTMGHVFAAGHMPASGAAVSVTLSDGTAVPVQMNVKALHPDGSVRHAIISGVLPRISAGFTLPALLKRAAAAPGGSHIGLPGSLPSATVTINGVVYTATASTSSPYQTWFSGPYASDFIFNVPFVSAGGTKHPTLTAQFSVRHYSNGAVRVDYVIEHCQAYTSTADIIYDARLTGNGTTLYTRTGLLHAPTARWKRSFWYGAAPGLHIKHDTAYLIGSKQVPNYDQRVKMSETTLAGYATQLSTTKFDPMEFGVWNPYMTTTGGRAEIGLMPDTYSATILSMDKRAKAIMLASADVAGTWRGNRRDDSTGPGAGLPLSVIHFPYATIAGNIGDANNPKTGKNEHLPALTTAAKGNFDVSHQPAAFYLPYLLTGDFYYLEGMHFWGTYNLYNQNPAYRQYEKGLISPEQLRGQGWSLRTIAECAAITPEDHPMKSSWQYWFGTNMDYYIARYLDKTDNVLGIITNGYSISYGTNGQPSTGTAPWMDDFFTQSLGHAIELLGDEKAKRLMLWKAKFQIGRLNDPAVCIQDACIYALGVRPTSSSPFFTTLAQCFDFTLSAEMKAAACNSPERLALQGSKCLPGDISGYPAATAGYPSNYQPALAMAVDSGYAGGDTAWAKFMARPTKPDYGTAPQFAVVPRT